MEKAPGYFHTRQANQCENNARDRLFAQYGGPAGAKPDGYLSIRRKPLTYSIKEIFYTLQGEGAQAGRPAVFCRFSGCNLWSGREIDRASAVCRFCDTDF